MFGFIHADSELCTRATSEGLVSFQLKGHDHAVKASQLRGGYQHPGEGSKVRSTHILKNCCCFFNIRDFANFTDFTTHLISLRSSSFSGLSKMARRGRTKSSITLSDKN